MMWVKCGAMPNPKYRVIRAISLRLRRYDGGWLAETPWLDDWGWGSSQSEAMIDVMRSIVTTHEVLSTSLRGKWMDQLFGRLSNFVQPR